jgi:integrase
LADVEHRLRAAIDYFGAFRELDSIAVPDVEAWMTELAKRPNGRGATLSASTRRHYLNAFSNLYRRAIGEGVVPAGYNPAAGVMEKPQPKRYEARWLEVHEAALLLEAARTYRPQRPDVAAPGIYPLLATFLLTGGRKSEVLGLDLGDVSFDRRTVTFRPNRHRRLKTLASHRVVPLWPQLEHALRRWVFERDEPLAEGLLFPLRQSGRVAMIGDLDKQLDSVGGWGGWAPSEIRSKMFRHTYCAARLQTTDNGAPVSDYTVARELGHGGRALVNRVYGHLGEVRHRSEVLEYLAEDFADILGQRLRALRAR